LFQAGAAQRDALVERDVVADLGGLADHHAHAVVDEDALADDRARVDLDAGEPARQVRDEAPQPLQAVHPAPVRGQVQPDGVQAWVAGDHLEAAARGRVAVEDALDVGSQAGKHEGQRM